MVRLERDVLTKSSSTSYVLKAMMFTCSVLLVSLLYERQNWLSHSSSLQWRYIVRHWMKTKTDLVEVSQRATLFALFHGKKKIQYEYTLTCTKRNSSKSKLSWLQLNLMPHSVKFQSFKWKLLSKTFPNWKLTTDRKIYLWFSQAYQFVICLTSASGMWNCSPNSGLSW